MKSLGWTCIILLLIESCDPCHDCGEPLNFDPTVELIFINNDTLIGLMNKVTEVSEQLTLLKTDKNNLNLTLDSLNTRLIEVKDLIENGDDSYEAEQADLITLIGNYTDSLSDYTKIIHDTDSIHSYWDDLREDVADGLIKIDTLYIDGQYLVYPDSFKSYQAPLLMNEQSFTNFKVVIGEYTGTISFDYELVESVDVTREIKLRARDIHPVSHTFDSISEPQCVTSECLDHETTVYLYF